MEIIELQLLARQLEGLGVALPDAAARALAVYTAAQEAAAASPSADLREAFESWELSPENVAEAIRSAALAENARAAAHSLTRDLDHPIRSAVTRALAEDSGKIIDQLRRPFDAAAAGVQRAAALFDPAVSVDQVLAADSASAREWQQLAEHADSLDRIRRARSAVDALSGGQPSPLVAGYITRAADEQALTAAAALFDGTGPGLTGPLPTGPGGRWHRLTHAGYELRLNSRGEAAQVIAAASSTTARTRAAADAARARRGPQRPDWSLTLPQPR